MPEAKPTTGAEVKKSDAQQKNDAPKAPGAAQDIVYTFFIIRCVATYRIDRDQVIYWLCQFKEGDIEDENFRRHIIDLLVNSVTVWDEPDGYRITSAYNLTSAPTKTFKVDGAFSGEGFGFEKLTSTKVLKCYDFRTLVEKRIAIQADCFAYLHPGILPMLSALKEKGIKIGLITNCFSEEAKLIRESELFPFFDAPCLSWEVGIRKPDPAIYYVCMEKLGIPVENFLYVGDGGSQELETARGLGMQAVQATWYRKADFERLQAALRPDFPKIDEPMELRFKLEDIEEAYRVFTGKLDGVIKIAITPNA